MNNFTGWQGAEAPQDENWGGVWLVWLVGELAGWGGLPCWVEGYS